MPCGLSSPIFSAQRLDHQRRQTFRRFVEQQQLRVAHQGAGDRQHLLLAAGQEAALAVAQFVASTGNSS